MGDFFIFRTQTHINKANNSFLYIILLTTLVFIPKMRIRFSNSSVGRATDC